MFYHNPNDPSQQLPADANAQPGYPYGSQNTQPGYPLPVTPRTQSAPDPNAATWYQPPAQVQQPGWLPAGAPQPTPPLAGAPQGRVRSRARSSAIFALTCVLVVIFGIGLFSGWTFARSSASANSSVAGSTSPSQTVSTGLDLQSASEAAIAKVGPTVVEVIGQAGQQTALGSGIIINTSGDIVTNNHVVNGANSLEVILNNGRSMSAQLVGTNPANDLAVLHIQPFAGMTVATLGDSSQLTIGQEVLAIGNPLGYSGTATSGVVSALNRSAQESRTVSLTGLIQTSAPINPGNSGGALINLQGQVVGIPTLSAVDSETNTPANGIGFAIPSNQVKTAVTQIIAAS